jgi:hypothetical protein
MPQAAQRRSTWDPRKQRFKSRYLTLKGPGNSGVATGIVEAVLVGELDRHVVEFVHAFASKRICASNSGPKGVISTEPSGASVS